jgi:DNA-binding beta-propeller fold protein YncE
VVAIATSPDGRSVYLALNKGAGAIRRCRLRRFAMVGPTALAVSPDGQSLYVASGQSGAIVRVRRSRRGKLAFGRCLSQCRQWQGRCGKAYGFRYPMSASVTPDGRSVLVGSARGAWANFKRGRRRDRRESAT